MDRVSPILLGSSVQSQSLGSWTLLWPGWEPGGDDARASTTHEQTPPHRLSFSAGIWGTPTHTPTTDVTSRNPLPSQCLGCPRVQELEVQELEYTRDIQVLGRTGVP